MNWGGVALCRLRLLRNQFRGRGRKAGSATRQRPLLGVTLALGLAVLIGSALAGVFGQLAAAGANAAESAQMLALVLTLALAGLLLFDLHESVSALVVDSDLELLRRAPISGAAVFLIKLADVFPRTSLLLIVLAIPAIVAFHLFYPLPAWSWLLLPAQLVALWSIPIGAGVAAAVLLIARVPPPRAREALGLLSTVALFVLWLVNSFLVPRMVTSDDDPMASLRGMVTQSAGWFRWSPGAWLAEALGGGAGGDWRAALAWTLVLLAAAAVALGASAQIVSRYLETTQNAVAIGAGRRRRRPVARPAEATTYPSPSAVSGTRPHPNTSRVIAAILTRDRRLFFRDWTLLGDVVTAAVLWTLLPLVGAPLYHSAAHALGRAMLVALTVGLGYEVAARAIPFERHGGAWPRLAPVEPWSWVAAKLLGAGAISLPLVLLASASMAFTLEIHPRGLLEAYAVVLPALFLSLSVGLWTGAAFGNPSWTNPRGMLTPTGRVIATGLLLVQAGAWLAFAAAIDHAIQRWGGTVLLLPACLAAGFGLLPLVATRRRLAAVE